MFLVNLPQGFYKVAQEGGTFITATFYNPVTKETITGCVRDYEYEDCRHDIDELYYMKINEEVKRQWLHDLGEILTGDSIKVYKGRKVPIGTIAKVIEKKTFKDRYGRTQAIYLYLDNGMKVNINNCIRIL